jgi:oligopeptide transport system permease protein
MRSTPGSPWDVESENKRALDPSTQKALEQYYGLNKPEWRQFVAYVVGDFDAKGKFACGMICGNLGPSYRVRGRTVQNIIFAAPPPNKVGEKTSAWDSRFGYSARLGLIALTIAIVLGIPIGIITALNQNTFWDYIGLFFATAGISVPSFVMGIFLIIIFAVWLHLLAVIPDDWKDPRAWILPALVLGFNTMAFTARLTRSAMLEVLRQDYIRTARSKGLAERAIVLRHMLKNALIPVVTILGPALAALVTGSFIIETMFSFPGMGREYVRSIFNRDYSMIMGTTVVYALLVALANLSVDFVYVLIDPRIRLEE